MSSWSCLLYFDRNNTFVSLHICENVMSRVYFLKKSYLMMLFLVHMSRLLVFPQFLKRRNLLKTVKSLCYMRKCVYCCSFCVKCEFQGLDSKVSLETCFEECSYGNGRNIGLDGYDKINFEIFDMFPMRRRLLMHILSNSTTCVPYWLWISELSI